MTANKTQRQQPANFDVLMSELDSLRQAKPTLAAFNPDYRPEPSLTPDHPADTEQETEDTVRVEKPQKASTRRALPWGAYLGVGATTLVIGVIAGAAVGAMFDPNAPSEAPAVSTPAVEIPAPDPEKQPVLVESEQSEPVAVEPEGTIADAIVQDFREIADDQDLSSRTVRTVAVDATGNIVPVEGNEGAGARDSNTTRRMESALQVDVPSDEATDEIADSSSSEDERSRFDVAASVALAEAENDELGEDISRDADLPETPEETSIDETSADEGVTPTAWVQIAAVASSAAAERSAGILKEQFPSLLGMQTIVPVRADYGDNGLYYYLRIPTGTRQEADELCASLLAAGGDCYSSDGDVHAI